MQRSLLPELMDDPQLEAAEHEQALHGLRRLNAWTGNANLAWETIQDLIRQSQRQTLSLLDVATGSADIPIALGKRIRDSELSLELSASDISQRALEFAKQESDQCSVNLRLFQHDVVAHDIPGQFDLVMCSQFLHHLSREDAVIVLKRMRSAATRRVIVIDLLRGRLNHWQVWLATRLLSRSRVVHFDGPQSIKAAFTLPEFEGLAIEAGFTSYRLAAKWPCRFIFSGETDGSD